MTPDILVTNRHILDPRSKLGTDSAYRLAGVEVELRAVASTSRPIVDAAEVAARTIGIMSGHFEERVEAPPEMFRHSGLSYLTRSTSILSLLAEARAVGLRRRTPFGGLCATAA